MKKKIFAQIMVLCMVLSCGMCYAQAEDKADRVTYIENGVTYISADCVGV